MDAARLAKDTPKSQKTRARILVCAMRLIAEIGYHAATNPAIADAAGLTRGAML
ncbi:MAG TPA: TetR family transcriptional regulator, partial [Caulobacter sp.]|nr:TetR family transcriptional regulator [Caulobacter sp.]